MIPPERYNKQSAEQLLQYLVVELDRAQAARRPLEDKWKRYQRLYRMEPETKTKDFPFPGCSNVVIGLAANDVDVVHSRLMAMLFTPPNLWTTGTKRPDFEDYAPRVGEFLQAMQDTELNMYPVVRDWTQELTKLGTSVLKTRYTRENRKVFEYREVADPMTGQMQTIQQQVRRMTKDGPQVSHVSIFDFYVPPSATDLQSAPWCAERVMLSWAQLVNRANAGIYTNVSAIKQFQATSRGSDFEQFMQQLDSYQVSLGDRYETFEFWLDWDIDGDGEQEAIVCSIHKESRTMMRLDFNPFFNQEKPYDVGRYLTQEKRFYGIGLCEMLDGYQDEISTMHNQRIDNKTVANAMVIIALRDGNIKQGEPIFPGRVILVDDMDSFKMQQMGTVVEDTTKDEELTMQLARQRTGVNDYIAGATDNAATGYSSATTAVQQLREGAKRFDQVLREIRQALASCGLRVLELYQQFNQGGKPYVVLGQKDGQMVTQVLNFPLELVRNGIAIDVTATSAAYNKETEIRTNTIIMQMLGQQFYPQIMQALMMALNPQVPPPLQMVAMKAVQGGTVLMKRILDDYGIQDTDKILPDMTEFFGGLQQQQFGAPGLGGFGAPQQIGPGAGPMGALPPGPSGMAALPPGYSGGQGFPGQQAGQGGRFQ